MTVHPPEKSSIYASFGGQGVTFHLPKLTKLSWDMTRIGVMSVDEMFGWWNFSSPIGSWSVIGTRLRVYPINPFRSVATAVA